MKQDRKREEKERRGLTFESQAAAYFDKTKTAWLLDMAISDFAAKQISEITSPMVLRFLRKLEAKENYKTAKRLRSKISAVFRFVVANRAATIDPTYAEGRADPAHG